METVNEERPKIQLWPAVASGYLRLSPHGLWVGEGTYTSPIVDLGEIYNLSGISWESEEPYQTQIDTTVGGMKTLEIRYHDYYEPQLNEAGFPWTNQNLAQAADPMWGEEGSIPWIPYANGDFTITGVMIRYVQWRAVLRGA
jgi:hypothetical protein